MLKVSLNLPLKRRLRIQITKRRGGVSDSFLPNFKEVQKVRKGSKLSRYFRLIFEHKKLNQLFRANIALAFVATIFLPNYSSSSPSGNFEVENPIITVNQITTTTQKGVRFPVEKVAVTQGFKFYHPGIDFDGVTGDPIYPVISGKVEAINYSGYGYGNAVLINHGNGFTSLYAHLSKITVLPDEEVNLDTQIGKMGATGHASGDHLHFEIRKDGLPINPNTILPQQNQS